MLNGRSHSVILQLKHAKQHVAVTIAIGAESCPSSSSSELGENFAALPRWRVTSHVILYLVQTLVGDGFLVSGGVSYAFPHDQELKSVTAVPAFACMGQ